MEDKEIVARANQLLAQWERARTSGPLQYMSGRWHRRDGDVYGIVVQPSGVADADSPPGDLRSSD